jgi:hypothetical protein
MTAEATFRAKAPKIMRNLMVDFAISAEDAAAIVGNLGHESKGLTDLQEDKPTVKGSRGGFGWAQWTGKRRLAYEAYCKRTCKNPASDEANYAYLFLELKGIEGTEKAALSKLQAATTLEAKTKAFELAFLRAGIKHYPSRIQWAKVALDAYAKSAKDAPETVTVTTPVGPPTVEVPPPPQTNSRLFASLFAILLAIGAGLLKLFGVN